MYEHTIREELTDDGQKQILTSSRSYSHLIDLHLVQRSDMHTMPIGVTRELLKGDTPPQQVRGILVYRARKQSEHPCSFIDVEDIYGAPLFI